MIRRALGQILRSRAGVSWLLFLPTAAILVFVYSTVIPGDAEPDVNGGSLAGQLRTGAGDPVVSPTPRQPAATALPNLEAEAKLILPTPLGPELSSEAVPTQTRNEANQLPAATQAAGLPAVDPPIAGQAQEPTPPAVPTEAPPPADTAPPPADTPPPPADTPPPPPVDTAPPPPPPTDQPTEAPPVQADVTICHVPSDNPKAAQTKTVGADALASHLAHGDTLGPCP